MQHRVIWKLYYKEEPPDLIDHIDCDTSNNKIDNLRASNKSFNVMNSIFKGNKTGFRGVKTHVDPRRRKRYYSVFRGKCLGDYHTPEEAHEAWKIAAKAYSEEHLHKSYKE